MIPRCTENSSLHYINITIVNDTSRVVRMVILSDAPSFVTYGCHSDNYGGVTYVLREHL